MWTLQLKPRENWKFNFWKKKKICIYYMLNKNSYVYIWPLRQLLWNACGCRNCIPVYRKVLDMFRCSLGSLKIWKALHNHSNFHFTACVVRKCLDIFSKDATKKKKKHQCPKNIFMNIHRFMKLIKKLLVGKKPITELGSKTARIEMNLYIVKTCCRIPQKIVLITKSSTQPIGREILFQPFKFFWFYASRKYSPSPHST